MKLLIRIAIVAAKVLAKCYCSWLCRRCLVTDIEPTTHNSNLEKCMGIFINQIDVTGHELERLHSNVRQSIIELGYEK